MPTAPSILSNKGPEWNPSFCYLPIRRPKLTESPRVMQTPPYVSVMEELHMLVHQRHLWWGPYNLWTLRYLSSTDGQIAMDSIQDLWEWQFLAIRLQWLYVLHFPEHMFLLNPLFTKRNWPFLKYSVLVTLGQGQWPQVMLSIWTALQNTVSNKIAIFLVWVFCKLFSGAISILSMTLGHCPWLRVTTTGYFRKGMFLLMKSVHVTLP